MNVFRLPLFSLALIVALAGCGRHEPAATPFVPPALVSVATVERVSTPELIVLPGTVRAIDRAVIAAKITGTIGELPWGLGQRVTAGALLVKLSAPEYVAQVSRARTQLEQAERELARDRALSERGAGTDDAVKRGVEQVQSARAALAEAEAMLAYTEIRAPFDGRITAKQAYPGDMALPGQTLLTLEGENRYEVEVAVPESYIANVKLADAVTVELQAGRVSASVAEIAAGADVASRSIMVKLRLAADARVSSGQFVRAWLAGPSVPRLRVPADAVTLFGQMERVFVVAEGRARLRLVRTGAKQDGFVEIQSGLDAGEKVVVGPSAALRDGQPVEVKP